MLRALVCGLHLCCVRRGVLCVCVRACLRARLCFECVCERECVSVCICVCVCMCIRRFYCLYGDSMNVAARMSANAKESGVCVSPQIAAHLASAAGSRCSVSASVSLPRLSSLPSVCLGSECASPAAHCASAAAHTATDGPFEELADAASEAHASACTTPRLSVVSRGVHLILSHLVASDLALTRTLTHVATSLRRASDLTLTHVARIASELLYSTRIESTLI